jgi:hypothetical protein
MKTDTKASIFIAAMCTIVAVMKPSILITVITIGVSLLIASFILMSGDD